MGYNWTILETLINVEFDPFPIKIQSVLDHNY